MKYVGGGVGLFGVESFVVGGGVRVVVIIVIF